MSDHDDSALRAYLSMHRGINLEMVDWAIAKAGEAGIALTQIEAATTARARCKKLFEATAGEGTDSPQFQHAMEAGQTLYMAAQNLNNLTELRAEVQRDRARTAGPLKERGSRMPLLDEWLAQKLARRDVSNDELWKSMQTAGDALYREDDEIWEVVKGKTRTTGRAGFDKRVSAIRKVIRR